MDSLCLLLLLGSCLCGNAAGQQPKPEPEPTSEPVPGGTADPGSSYAEPTPEWTTAMKKWGVAWHIHIYMFGVTFALVAIYALLSIIRLYKKKHLLSQPYFISLNVMVFLIGILRSLYLLVDPYNYPQIFPLVASYLVYNTVLPCVTSAFSLMFLALLAATKMSFISKSVTKVKVILLVIFVHFILSISADVLLGLQLDARVLLFVCQVLYLIWGVILFIGFMVIFKRLNAAAELRQKLMHKHLMRKFGLSAKQHPQQKLTLSLAVKVTLFSSLMGLLTIVLHLFGMIKVYGVFYQASPKAWEWWGYHTAFRTVELLICIAISYVATQPFRYQSTKSTEEASKSCHCFVCAPCWSWFYREHSYLLAEGWSDFQTDSEWVSDSVRRQESQKGDFPLHHMRRISQDPSCPNSLLNTNMLKADHGQLHFTSDEQTNNLCNTDSIENPYFYHSSNDLQEQATLKIERDMNNMTEKSNLLTSSEMKASKEELLRIGQAGTATSNDRLNLSASQCLTDRVSQLSYEIDDDSDTESNELLADV